MLILFRDRAARHKMLQTVRVNMFPFMKLKEPAIYSHHRN